MSSKGHNPRKQAPVGWGPWPWILGVMVAALVGLMVYSTIAHHPV